MFSNPTADSPQDAEPSGFHEFSDGLLDHLAEANDRIELDLFDNQVDVVPEFAPQLVVGEQDLVDKMQATVDNAQEAAQQRRMWGPSSVALVEHRLHAAVQKQQPSEADEAVRRRVLQDMNALVQPGLLGYTGMHVAPYGSFVSGLYTSTGDLDISIEGCRTRGSEQIPCAELGKEDKIQLLKALGKKLTNARMVRGQMERILHARVPIIKFKHSATGLDCDISVASGAARFKSTVLRYLADIDSRFGSLVRLVKLWAGAHGMNDAAAGTFNSFALTLMFKHTAAKLGVTGPEASALAHHWASPEATGLPMTPNDALEDSAHQEQLHRPHHYGDGKHNQLAMGLDLRQASIGPGDDALFAGDPHNVPRRQGLQRMSSMQQQVLGDLLRVRTLVRQHTAKHDESRTQEYLYAAARGDTSQIQQMLQQGFPPDSCDYDKRTGLMLASTRGHIPVVELLLAAGAPVDQLDSFGQTALSEACKFGQEETIAVLRRAGANLNETHKQIAYVLCQCIFDGDMALMRRYIKAGVDIDIGDYDQRTALHIAAAEVNLPAIKLLVEEGKADVLMTDRWGSTALDEVLKLNASRCIAYLQPITNAAKERQRLEVEREAALDAEG